MGRYTVHISSTPYASFEDVYEKVSRIDGYMGNYVPIGTENSNTRI